MQIDWVTTVLHQAVGGNLLDKKKKLKVPKSNAFVYFTKNIATWSINKIIPVSIALDGTETKALAVLESKKLEEPTASLDHNKLPDFNELKKGKRVIGIENIIKGIIFQITYSCFFPNRKGGR